MRSPTTSPARVRVASSVALWSGALSAVLLAFVAAEWGPLVSFDRAVADGLHDSAVRRPGLTGANRVLSDWVWDPWTMRALVAAGVVWLWWRGERLLAVWAAAVSLLGSAVQQVLKVAVGRDRPRWRDPVDWAHFAAFPSGHAMTAAVTCGLLLWLLALFGAGRRLWAAALLVGAVSAVGVGLTRLYLGVHWASDVVGGWLLGVCLVAVAVVTYERTVASRRV
ncbi:phosphatase PAP2 family protein [Streptomyces sp. WAC05374]|uniref:phosphatase PAP2 family protein n=1 Tax=Streptomyces sp. WAC05374 TaxID=2487420 RepID=UPI000F8767B5|nr:phosphatase PAP2 family protein [Streptomyces sp. WAC05374]RST18950.1 phosphatase PAP2 family protein [Streptomyces sp. WAC05374]TDF56925.1 phosphatase PAP2 family protein [Streptomyces sp. WAC05374]TDF60888.1 phosphatase PAP2 family protein [Streptomyces sp. WAC05374]